MYLTALFLILPFLQFRHHFPYSLKYPALQHLEFSCVIFQFIIVGRAVAFDVILVISLASEVVKGIS